MNNSSERYDLLDLDRDLPTTKEDVERLWELSNMIDPTSMVELNRLPASCWTLEKALSKPLFSDDYEPFEL